MAAAAGGPSSYLSRLPADKLPDQLRAAIAELEPQFDVDLHAVLKQMLWEYNEGLNKRVTTDNADTFLPMMCAAETTSMSAS